MSGIQVWLISWVPPPQCLFCISRQAVGWDCSHLKAQMGLADLPLSSFTGLLAGLRRPTSKITHIIASRLGPSPYGPLSRLSECPYNVAANDLRESHIVPQMEPRLFITNLRSDIHHWAMLYLLDYLRTAHTQGQSITQIRGYLETGVIYCHCRSFLS